MGFSENIKALMVSRGIKPKDLAATVGVTPATVSRWVNRKMTVRDAHIERICAAYDVTRDELLADDGGLAQGMGRTPFELPLYDEQEVLSWETAKRGEARVFVEVSAGVARSHPNAFVMPVGDNGVDRIVPIGSHAVVDPDLKPDAPSNGAPIVAVNIVYEEKRRVGFRRLLCGNRTALLSTDSIELDEDRTLASLEGLGVIGTVVWFQASEQLC